MKNNKRVWTKAAPDTPRSRIIRLHPKLREHGLAIGMGLFLSWTGCADASSCPGAAGERAEADYRAGLAEYRAGHPDESYRLLQRARTSCPMDERIFDDFLVVASGAGHNEEALTAASGTDPSTLPNYVLESLGHAARDAKEPTLALRYYDAILARHEDVTARVGRDLALIDNGMAQEAEANLVALRKSAADRIDVLEALGLADEALGRPIDALAAAEAILGRAPNHRGAQQLRYRMLVRVGAPRLALDSTPASVIGPGERDAARRDELVFEFRWARDDPASDLLRAERLDAVIARMRAVESEPALDEEVRRGLRGDLVEALAERGRSREAVSDYEAMVADGLTVPSYVTGAAATAYLALKEPAHASALFESIPVDATGPSYGLRASYFYALLESEKYDPAVRYADAIAASEPVYQYANFPGLRTENGPYGKALVLAALARTYTDRPIEGQARLDAILEIAPADADAQEGLAETYAARGWPRKAAYTSRGVLLDDPEATSPLAQLFSDYLAMGDWRAAYRTLVQMQALLPPNNAQRLHAERDWETHEMAEVIIDASFGQSFGGRAGVVDSEIETYVYSSPFAWDYRAYLHLNLSEGDPVQGRTYRHAVGGGLEYHTQDWLATAELLEIDRGGPYPQVSVAATPDDYWKIGAAYAERSLETPIAAVVVGVHADRLALTLDYRVSEARAFGAELAREQFSDSNLRSELSSYWRERWITGPVYKLDTRVDLGTSENTLDDTNYFNPRRDTSATLTFENQWLQFRHYDRSLSHELDLGVGDYVQQGYGAGLIALVRYQIVYEVNDRLTLRAGIGRTLRPFDGVRERLDVVTFNLTGRL